MNKLERFLVESYPPGSYNYVLRKFLLKRADLIAEASTTHLFHSLFPIGEALQNPLFKDITHRDLKTYVENLWLRYSAGSIRPMVGDIQQFAGWCKRKGHHKKNIAKRLKKPKVRSRQPLKAARSEDVNLVLNHLREQLRPFVYKDLFDCLQIEETHLWSDCDLRNLRDLFILSFLFETGCRAKELTQLSVKEMRQVTAERSQVYTVVTGVGKTADHDYFFTDVTADLWRVWDQVRDQTVLYAVYGWRLGEAARSLLTNGVSQMLIRRCQQADVAKPFRAHALRHAKVKRSRQSAGIEVAKVLVDHADIETTWGYANIDEDELQQAVLSTGVRCDLWK